ncbi:MAG: UDP-3-O-(3-hydroxymyristoyl)glucosamine N-acyltransferase, partial [Sphingobacteriaceae bacterium]
MADLSKHDCKVLSEKIRNDFYKPLNSYKSTIFLCGAALSDKTTARFKFAEALKKAWYRNQYDIVYPEDIFEELLYSSQSKDLLSLENLLAESVDAIVLIPESVGSIAELGAFANDIKLRGKIICVLDERYKKHKSFINQGPVKLIKKTNKDGVIYINPDNIANEIDKIIASVKKLKKTSSKA